MPQCPQLRFRRPSKHVEGLRRMEQADGECQRSAERMRYLFATMIIGVAPLAVFLVVALAALVPVAGPWLSAVLMIPGFVSLFVLLPAQFAVFQKAHNSIHLQRLDRVAVSVFCVFFTFSPIVTLLAFANGELP